jgi:hypothetical protein
VATTTTLSNPTILINAVDYTDNCSAVTLTTRFESLEATAFGDTARKYTKGLGNHEVTVTLMLAYDTAEIEALLAALVGTTTTVVVYATNSQTPGVTNPEFELVGTYLESYTPVNASIGELQTVDLTFTGGVLTRSTT